MPANTIDVMEPDRCLSQAWPAPTGLNFNLAAFDCRELFKTIPVLVQKSFGLHYLIAVSGHAAFLSVLDYK